MKYLSLMVVVLVLLCGVAYADQTGTTFWHSHSYTDNVGAADKYSEYQKKLDWPMGIGLDAILYEFEGTANKYGLDTINVESKYDIANGGCSVFGVVHVNAYRAIKDLLK